MTRVLTVQDTARMICKACRPGREYTLMEIAERNKTNSKAVMAAAEYLEDMGLASIGAIYGGKSQVKTLKLATTAPHSAKSGVRATVGADGREAATSGAQEDTPQ